MTKELAKFKSKSKRKAEYSVEGMAVLEEFRRSNRGRTAQDVNPVLTGGPKRGYGRGKARDAGPSKRRRAA